MSSYQTAEKDGLLIVTTPPNIGEEDANVMESNVKTWLLSPAKTHVLDMKDTKNFKPMSYRSFVLYNQALRANNKTLFVLNINADLLDQLHEDGLSSVFVPVTSLEEAKKKGSPPKATIDVEFVNPFISAARNVLETQAQIQITPGKPVLKKQDDRFQMEIAGVIAVSCAEFTGSINICFRAEVFLKIYESLTGEKHTVIASEIEDAAAEILNMIFGQAKTELNDQKGYTLDRAMPSVLTGEKLHLHHQARVPVIVVPFESSVGPFHLEIVVEKS